MEIWIGRAKVSIKDLWWFLKYFVRTKDEHDPSTSFKPFPQKLMYRGIARVVEESTILFIEKSRQVMMTWIMSAVFLWFTMFIRNQLNMYQSKKQEDANKILGRSKHIYEGLAKIWPLDNLPRPKTTGIRVGTDTNLEFPEFKSEIEAIAQGPDIIRMNTCSNILSDEISHQVSPGEAYAAAKPTLSGGGRFIGQGTPNGKVFNYQMMYAIDRKSGKKLGENVIDSNYIHTKRFTPPQNLSREQQRYWIEKTMLNLSDDEFKAIPLDELFANIPGMRYWVTCDGVACLRVHYSADPDKSPDTAKGRSWIENEKIGQAPDKWEREYEISYDTYEGRPVISNWDRNIFVKSVNYDCSYGLELSVDFGTRFACVFFAQYVPVDGFNFFQLKIIDEIRLENSDTNTLATLVVNKIKDKYKKAWDANNIRCRPDPAGNQTRETTSDKSLNSSIKIFRAHGIKCSSKKLGVADSTQFVQTVFAQVAPNGEPAVLIDSSCEYAIGTLSGGWHFPEVDDGVHTGKPEKDGEWDHGGDAIRHLICNTFNPRDFGNKRRSGYKYIKIYQKGTGRPIGRKRVAV